LTRIHYLLRPLTSPFYFQEIFSLKIIKFLSHLNAMRERQRQGKTCGKITPSHSLFCFSFPGKSCTQCFLIQPRQKQPLKTFFPYFFAALRHFEKRAQFVFVKLDIADTLSLFPLSTSTSQHLNYAHAHNLILENAIQAPRV